MTHHDHTDPRTHRKTSLIGETRVRRTSQRMPLAQNDAPNRHRRGFSLIELVVVMVTLAIVIPLIIRFTTNTLDLSDSQVSRARMLAIADEAIVQVEADLKAARSCRASLLDPPVIAITPNSIEFVADLAGDGRGSYVRYEIEDTEIGRLLVRTTSTIPDGDSVGVGDEDGVVSETERCSWTVEANQTR